jgi:hypothetical protein
MGISPRLATRELSDNAGSFQRAIGRGQRTQELLQLHDGAARSQVVVHRVAVGVVLAMGIVEVVVVDGRRSSLISYKLGHAGRPLCARIRMGEIGGGGGREVGERRLGEVKAGKVEELYSGGIGWLDPRLRVTATMQS